MTITQEAKNADNAYLYLKQRFLKKDRAYFDCIGDNRPKYSADDLKGILLSLGWSNEHTRIVMQRLRQHDLDVWSGKEVFRPAEPRIVPTDEGTSDINNWRPSQVVPTNGDATPFIDYLRRLVPEQSERQWLLDFLAFKYQNPASKQRHAVILFSAKQGVGKSTLKDIISAVYANTKCVDSTDGLVGRFACPNWNGSWVVAEEIKVTTGGTTYNALKAFITEEKKQGERKGQDFTAFDTPASLLLLTNSEPSFIEATDRRFFIVEVKNDESAEELASYFAGFRKWLQRGGLEAIAGLLGRRDTYEYFPDAPPPCTAVKSRLIGLVGSGLGQEVQDWIEDRPYPAFTESQIKEGFPSFDIERLRHHFAGYQKHPERVQLDGDKHWVWHKSDTKVVMRRGVSAKLVLQKGTEIDLKELVKHDYTL